MARGKREHSYAKLQLGWNRDPVLQEVAAEHGVRVLAYWTVLITESKRELDKHDGWVTTSHLAFAADACDDRSRPGQRVKVWRALAASGLVELDGDPAGRLFRVRPTSIGRIQSRRVEAPAGTELEPSCDALGAELLQSSSGVAAESLREMQGFSPRAQDQPGTYVPQNEDEDHARATRESSISAPPARTDELPGDSTPDDEARAEIRRLRGRMSVAAMEADEVAAKWRRDHPDRPASAELRQVWQPLDVVRIEQDGSVHFRKAMAAYAASRKRIPAVGAWIRATANGMAEEGAAAVERAFGPDLEADERFRRHMAEIDAEAGAA
jgi:hypothetical protein